jgi:hypothetical protein
MSKYKVEVNAGTDNEMEHDHLEHDVQSSVNDSEDFSTKAVTLGVVVVGAALIEAALIPGIVIGAAAAMAPKYLPKMEKTLHPMFNSTVRGIYKMGRKARNAFGEVKEHMNDIAAEVKAEEMSKASEPAHNMLETETT